MEAALHAAARFAEHLAKNHLKMTRERRAILDRILALRGHFDVDELHSRLTGSGLDVSRATLYRTLPVLVEAGLVHKIEMERGQARYEPMFGRHHHDHMVCVGCGEIFEFENREIERLQEEVCRRRHFRMTGHTHQIRGYCAGCQERSTARGSGAAGGAAGRGDRDGALERAPAAAAESSAARPSGTQKRSRARRVPASK